MASEGLSLTARATVKLTKLNEHGQVIDRIEQEVDLTREEAEALWLSQQQE